MNEQQISASPAPAPLAEIRQLRSTLALLSALSGEPAPDFASGDEDRRYDRLTGIAQRRHDALAAEATACAATGVSALIGRAEGAGRAAAARLLGQRLRRSLDEMERVLAG